MKRFANTGGLLRFILRRDRLRLPVWILSIAAFSGGLVPLFEDFLLKGTSSQVFADMMQNPAMIAIAGPVYGYADYHVGAAYANMMLVFCALMAAAMNIFYVARHTRADEEAGRAELLRSRPVGRGANLTSVFAGAGMANLALALLTAGIAQYLAGEGMTTEGNLLFGFSLGVIGLFFAGLTGLIAQIPENTRSVTAGTLLLMMGMYLLRGAGDLYSETLARLSPLGLVLRTQVYVNNEWWPLAILMGAGLVLTVLTFVVAGRRDLGAGLLQARAGKREGSPLLHSPGGLSFRLLRNHILIWAVVVFSFAAMYAAVFDEMDRFIQSSDMLRQIFAANPDFTPLEQFVSLLNALMAMLTAIPVLGMVHRLAGEEESGRIHNLYGRAVSRGKNFLAWLVPAFLVSILLQLLVALAFWSVGTYITPQTPSLQTFLTSALSFLPAIWILVALGAFLVGVFPKKRILSYLYLGFSFFLVYVGSVADFPAWIQKTSPFGHVSKYPVEEVEILPLLVMVAITGVLILLAYRGYRQRDLQTE